MRTKNKYKLIISNKMIYKEIELSDEFQRISAGTMPSCDVRLRKELFFEPFSLDFYNREGEWEVKCSEDIYISEGDFTKQIILRLRHGREYQVKYRATDNELLRLTFSLDFGSGAESFFHVIKLPAEQTISIGTPRFQCDVVVRSEYSDSECVVFQPEGDSLKVIALKTQHGTYLNGGEIEIGSVIHDMDFISVAEVTFYFKSQIFYVDRADKIETERFSVLSVGESATVLEYPVYNRSTRVKIQLNTEPIEILDPPSPLKKPKKSMVLQLLPMLSMLILVIVVRGFMSSGSNLSFLIFSVCSISIGCVTSFISLISEKKEYKKGVEKRREDYLEYIEDKEKRIQEFRKEETKILNEKFYEVHREIQFVESFSKELFDRQKTDEDFLQTRIGIGDRIAERKIAYKRQEKFETEDELANLPEHIYWKYRMVQKAPVTLDLARDNAVGIIGKKDAAYEVVKVILLDVMTRQYMKDLELILMIPEEDRSRYQWARWIPHLYNPRLKVRNIVWNEESKNVIFEYLYTELGKRTRKEGEFRQILVISQCDWGIKEHPVSKYIEKASELSAAFIFCEEYQELLPLGCSELLMLKSEKAGRVIDTKNRRNICSVELSHIHDAAIEKAARKLAPVYCEEVNLENALTKKITLYDLLGIYDASDLDFERRWQSLDVVQTLAAPVGVKTKNQKIFLDLHEKAHGPHGLVAGTTGSGKSELLQTYILSMATLYHPYEVGFVIIDFKGGGMVNQFASLPHLMGAITNIDGREIQRSLQSIKAELQKRQRLFAQYNVNNINAYIRLYKNGAAQMPLPHLILIVDEFAELKAEQPEFMKELISASRIGRSLGVHLILATQKPSGQVSEQIWSNSRFKLCLKVQTKEDSNEVLKTPLAAEIKEAGRAYFQVGNNEIFELFQSAYSGAGAGSSFKDGTRAFSISQIGFGGGRKVLYQKKIQAEKEGEQTQLSALVRAVADYCKAKKILPLPEICLPPLPEVISFQKETVSESAGECLIPIGIYDDPGNQYQGVLNLDLSSDNALILGTVQMGKTNILRILIRAVGETYTPQEVQIYILDFASMALKVFENMHHVGGVVIPGENERLKNLFKLLKASIQERKTRMLESGVSSFKAYWEAGCREFPRILVLLDNFSVFRELYEETFQDDFQFLTREGAAYGVNFVVTNTRSSGIGYRYMANFGNRIALTCNEASEYSSLFEYCRMEPQNKPGRVLCKQENELYEAQTYLAFDGEREIERAKEIRSFIEKVNAQYSDMRAREIPAIPQVLDFQYLRRNFSLEGRPFAYPVALDYAEVEVHWLELGEQPDLCIVGKAEAAKLAVTRTILQAVHAYILEYPARLFIVDSLDRPLKSWADMPYVEDYTIDSFEIGRLLEECEEEMRDRQEILKTEGPEGLARMPMLLYLFQDETAVEVISDSKEQSSLYQSITKMSRMLKIVFIFTNIRNETVGYNSPAILKRLKENRRAFLTDKLSDQKFYEIPLSAVRALGEFETGDVYSLNGSEIRRIKMAKE